MKKLPVIVLSLLMLVGAGCTSQTARPPAAPSPTEEVSTSIDGSWQLKSFAGPGMAAQDVSEIGATLTIEPGAKLSAKICNSMSGTYEIEAGKLKAGALVSTKMACMGLAGDVEAAFAQGLSTGMVTKGSANALVLRSDAGAEFSYVRAADTASGDEPSEDRTYSGVVTSVDLEHMKVDGPGVVVIRTESGAFAKILVPSMGLNLCKAKGSIADVFALKVGQNVEARGSIGSETDSIVPCQSEAHYLRVVKQ